MVEVLSEGLLDSFGRGEFALFLASRLPDGTSHQWVAFWSARSLSRPAGHREPFRPGWRGTSALSVGHPNGQAWLAPSMPPPLRHLLRLPAKAEPATRSAVICAKVRRAGRGRPHSITPARLAESLAAPVQSPSRGAEAEAEGELAGARDSWNSGDAKVE
jgi:hypothetical protein